MFLIVFLFNCLLQHSTSKYEVNYFIKETLKRESKLILVKKNRNFFLDFADLIFFVPLKQKKVVKFVTLPFSTEALREGSRDRISEHRIRRSKQEIETGDRNGRSKQKIETGDQNYYLQNCSGDRMYL
jgi:hypothetical protein